MHIEGGNNEMLNINSQDFYGGEKEDRNSLFCFCFPCGGACSVLGTLFFPCLWVMRLVLPMTMMQNAATCVSTKIQGVKDQVMCVFDSVC